MIPYNPKYGNYRTRTLSQIIDDYNWDTLFTDFSVILEGITQEQRDVLYIILMSAYGESHVANMNENTFIMQFASKIASCAPAFFKYKQLQDALSKMSLEEMIDGGTSILNHASNPNISPSDQTLTELTYIDSQTVNKLKKNKLQAYAEVISLIDSDIYAKFISKFQPLFLRITMPQSPLYYENDIEEEEQDNE